MRVWETEGEPQLPDCVLHSISATSQYLKYFTVSQLPHGISQYINCFTVSQLPHSISTTSLYLNYLTISQLPHGISQYINYFTVSQLPHSISATSQYLYYLTVFHVKCVPTQPGAVVAHTYTHLGTAGSKGWDRM